MALEISEPHRGNQVSRLIKGQADPSSLGTIDPNTYQLMMNQEHNFVISHPSQRLAREETNDREHRLSSPSSGRMTRKEDTRKSSPESSSGHRHHQNECDRISSSSLLQHHNSSFGSQATPETGADSCLSESERISSPDISDSPLDFSTKRHRVERKTTTRQELDSPCSRLRNILSMKSPCLEDDMAGTVLNLSKESGLNSPGSGRWNSTPSHSSSANNSHSSSPTTMDTQSFSPASSRPPSIPAPAALPQHLVPTNMLHSMAFPHYGMFSPNMGPMMSQAVPGSDFPLGFDQNHSMFHHVAATASAGSPTLPFGATAPLLSQTNSSVSNGNGKARVTRPFKAYPKDPMAFPGMGIYGLPPMGTSAGGIETQQQSNHAYAEFRKQMLTQSQGKSKRVGQKNCPTSGPLSDSTTSSTNPLNYGLGMIEPGAMSSGAEEYLSTSDDGYCSLAKNRLIKSEDQMKDEAYWERRRKNNEAAKRSRDARRAKEDEIAIRASFLEQENLKLRFEVCALKNETAKLRCLLYKSP